MNKTITFLLIFCLNSVLTYFYIYFLIGTFDVQEIRDSFEENPVPLLYDIMQYNLGAESLSLEDAINHLFDGSTVVHAAVLGYFFESKTLYSGLIVNSAFVALTFALLHGKNKATLVLYILLAPFFVFYSVGWTKEIIYALALAFFLRSILVDSKNNFYLSLIISLLSRPQLTPFFIIALITKNVRKKRFIIFTLIVIAIAPIWLMLTPTAYTDIAEANYINAGGQGVSIYTDYLKMNVPILSIVGYLASVSKLYYEPLSSLIASNGTSIYAWVELNVQIIFLVNLVRTRFKIFENKIVIYLFLLINVFVTSLPFTHFRYLLPLLAVLVIYSMVVVPTRVKLKTMMQDA